MTNFSHAQGWGPDIDGLLAVARRNEASLVTSRETLCGYTLHKDLMRPSSSSRDEMVDFTPRSAADSFALPIASKRLTNGSAVSLDFGKGWECP